MLSVGGEGNIKQTD